MTSESRPSTAWLTIRRTSAEDVQQRELYASLDGKRIAIILYEDVATVAIPPGRHELRGGDAFLRSPTPSRGGSHASASAGR